jgi:hypothetical protein
VELPELAKLPDPPSLPFTMMISSLSRTERTADLIWIFKMWCDLNQSKLDSHAHMRVAGADKRVMDLFLNSYQTIKDIMIASVATAWDDPETGKVIVL